MNPETWTAIKKIFEAALSVPGPERDGAVSQLCGCNEELRGEVQKLLAAHDNAGSFLQAPALAVAYPDDVDAVSNDIRTFRPMELISERFLILRFVDRGGMGEVYEAWDSELGDRVALKTIRPEISSNPGAISRFKHEVKQARGISHPNICRVYDLFSHQEGSLPRIWFLTMEFLPGETLLDRITRLGKLPLKEAFELTEQLVEGLAAAHRIGIVHRDFKSNNVILTSSDGGETRAVVTDFGLAQNVSISTSASVAAGQGTPGYMAPEQHRGEAVGFAADQYALGVVICEMVSGVRPEVTDFSRWSLSLPNKGLPPRWDTAVRRCLQVHPEERFKELQDILTSLVPSRKGIGILWKVAIPLSIVALVLGIDFTFSTKSDKDRLKGIVQLTASTDLSTDPSLSRDGRTLAYMSDRAESGNLDVWVQKLPSGAPMRLTTNPAQDGDPSISPDGKSVVFRSDRDAGGIYFSSTAEVGERLLIPYGRGPRFSPSGNFIAYWTGDEDKTVPSGEIYLFDVAGGRTIRLASGFKDARQPAWSADGRYIIFTGCSAGEQPVPSCSDWWVTTVEASNPRPTGAMTLLRAQGVFPKGPIVGWINDAVLFCARHGQTTSLWRLRLAEANAIARDIPEQLTAGYATNVTEASTPAENGSIAFARLSGAVHIWQVKSGHDPHSVDLRKITNDADPDISPYISQNGQWLAFARGAETLHQIWLREVRSGSESVIFASNVDKASPLVNDSGDTIVFEERSQTSPGIYVKYGNQNPRLLCRKCSKPSSFFDGNSKVFYREGQQSKIGILDVQSGISKIAISSDNAALSEANWSSATEYLVFTASYAGGKNGIFAVRFPRETASTTGEWISIGQNTASNDHARWSRDGKTIYYRSNTDGFSCIWGQLFDPKYGRTKGRPFPVVHFHNSRLTPEAVTPASFEISVFKDSIYLNLAEVSASIWTGNLTYEKPISLLDWFSRTILN